MAKKIEIIYDINGKAIDVAIDKTLNLKRQAVELTKELRSVQEGSDEFKILSSRLGDTQDALAKTNAKSKDLFSSLSMLPGPVGDFFASLTSSIEVLKTFSSFTLKDLRFQLGETANDVADIGENLLGLNEIQAANTAATEAEVAAVEQLAAAEAEATVSTEAHVAVVEAETVATEAAEVATIGLGAALKAIGIGFLLAGLAALVVYWDKISDAITGATDKSRAYNDAQKQVTKDLTDFNIKLFEVKNSLDAAKKGTMSKKDALKDYNDKLGKTIGYAGSLEQAESLMAANTATVIESIKLRAQAQIFYGKSAEAAAKLVSGEALELTFWDQAFNAIKTAGDPIRGLNANLSTLTENVIKTQKTATDFAAEGDKLINQAIENDKKLKKGLAEAPKDGTTKENQDKELLEKAQKLQEDLTAVQKEAGQKREKQEIQNAADAEIREIKKLNISAKYEQKRQDAIADVQKIADRKKREIDEKYAEEQKKKDDDRLKDIQEWADKLKTIEISSILDTQEKAKAERKKGFDDTKRDLDKALADKKISQAQYDKAIIDATKALNQDLKKIDDDKAKEDQDKRIKKLDDELKFLQIKGEALHAGTKAYFENQQAILDAAEKKELENTELTEAQKTAIVEKYAALRKKSKEEEAAANWMVASQTLDAMVKVTDAIASSYDEEAKTSKDAFEKRKKLQKATAIMSAASGIIQILSQPSTLPSPFDWIVKGLNAAALGIATGIQIKNIDNTKFEGGSAGTSASGENSVQSLGRNYGDGGMIDGPRHAQGGVMINAEGGEAVMTRGAVTMFAPLLSTLNQMGGGTSFNKSLQGATYDAPKPSNENNQMIIKTYVVENELTSQQQKQARLKDLSTL
jgi:hypothetical protein